MAQTFRIMCFLVVLSVPLSAQQVSDVNDRLYTDLELWQARGILGNLPPLRPYPLQVVEALLRQVQTSSDAADADRARAYLDELSGAAVAHLSSSGEARTDATAAYYQLGLKLQMQGALSPSIAYSAALAGIASTAGVGALLPEYERPAADVIYDASVAPLGSSGLIPHISMTGSASFGSDSLSFQAGILRAAYGPVWGDSIVLSPTAPQAGQFSVVIRQESFSLTMVLLDIAATSNDGAGGPLPNKFLSFHSIEAYPTEWLALGIFESVVWGNRFEPLYLLPLPTVFFVAQGLVGYLDNSLLGLSASVRLPASVKTDFILYVDDASFNDLIKLNFNTMLVLAGQAQVSWTPHLPWLEQISLGYTMVTPYTYSHIDAGGAPDATNYLNYTNGGQNMATSLEPDSDRIELHALARPLSFLDLDLFARFMRHGNASEGITSGDGTLFDSGWLGGIPTFAPGSGYPLPRFLTQAVIEKTLQAGLRAAARAPTSFGTFEGSLSYTFEYSWNYGLGAGNRLANDVRLELGYRY